MQADKTPRKLLRNIPTSTRPLTAIEVLGMRQRTFREADTPHAASPLRSQIAEERHNGFDVEAEIEGVGGVEGVGSFFVDLLVCLEDGGVDDCLCLRLPPFGTEVVC